MASRNLWISLVAGIVVCFEIFGVTSTFEWMSSGHSIQRQTTTPQRKEEEVVEDSSWNDTVPPFSSAERWSLPSRNRTGSWIGDCWLPPSPEWRLYSAREMQDIFRGQRIAFAGDSLARRAAMTLFPILNHTTHQHQQQQQHQQQHEDVDIPLHVLDNPHDLILNKASKKQEPCHEYQWNGQHSPRICRFVVEDAGTNTSMAESDDDRPTTVPTQGQVWHIWDPCFSDLISWFRLELVGRTNVTDGLDIMVVGAAIHDVQANPNCHKNQPWQQTTNASYYEELTQVVLERLDTLLQLMGELQQAKPHLTIVWKTSGYSTADDSAHAKEHLVDRINERALDLLDEQQQQAATTGDVVGHHHRAIQYIHWGGAVKARSFGKTRIKGDSINHYGVEARLVALQMLTNVVVVVAQQRESLG